MTLRDPHLETPVQGAVCEDRRALEKMQVLGWGLRLGNSYEILRLLLLLVCVPHSEWQGSRAQRGSSQTSYI